jgi:hypothetical protein
VLANSFFIFFLETLALSESTLAEGNGTPCKCYLPLLFHQATNFKRFRAASNLLLQGYPLFGVALLRDLKDQAILLAGVGNGLTTYPKLWGLESNPPPSLPLSEADWQKGQRQMMKEEQHVFDFMLRASSGLEEEHRQELAFWEKLFHQEVHGSRFTYMKDFLRWLNTTSALPTTPILEADIAGMYANRADEVSWMLLRTLPMLQLRPGAFGVQWARRWTMLDESFRFASETLAQSGTRIGATIIYFVETKFRFTPQSTSYTEADPKLPS